MTRKRKKKNNQNEASDLMKSLFYNDKSDDGLPSGSKHGSLEKKNPNENRDWRGTGGYSPPSQYKRHSRDRQSEFSVDKERTRQPEPDNWRSEDRKHIPSPSPDGFGQMREPEPDNWRSDKNQYTPPTTYIDNKSVNQSYNKSEKIQKDSSFWSNSTGDSDNWR